MSKKKKRKAVPLDQWEILSSIRGSWEGVNPVTKVIPNKKGYRRKEKYPPKYWDNDDENEQKI